MRSAARGEAPSVALRAPPPPAGEDSVRRFPRQDTLAKAQQLRRSMTRDEAQLWQMLRQRPNGCKFRRQHPIGPYILDFFCDAVSLAVEVDGPSHSQAAQAAHDARRTSWLGRQGISVLRIAAEDVRFRPQNVLTAITTRCPPPQGEVPRRGGGGFAATAAPVEEPHP